MCRMLVNLIPMIASTLSMYSSSSKTLTFFLLLAAADAGESGTLNTTCDKFGRIEIEQKRHRT